MSRAPATGRRRRGGRGASRQGEAPRSGGGFGRFCKRLGQGLLVTALLAGAGLGLERGYERLQTQKVGTVKIEGKLAHVDEHAVKQAMRPFMHQGMVSIDLEEVKRVLEALPWVRKATVRRQWPDSMLLQLEEQVAIARWGEDALLNQQGEVFRPRGGPSLNQLPVLTGPAGEEYDVMVQYQRFSKLLYPLGLKLISLDKSQRGAWELLLANGLQVRVGTEDVMLRMRRLAAFLGERQAGAGRAIDSMESIDLRYAHGLAVNWREGEEEAAEPAVVAL